MYTCYPSPRWRPDNELLRFEKDSEGGRDKKGFVDSLNPSCRVTPIRTILVKGTQSDVMLP